MLSRWLRLRKDACIQSTLEQFEKVEGECKKTGTGKQIMSRVQAEARRESEENDYHFKVGRGTLEKARQRHATGCKQRKRKARQLGIGKEREGKVGKTRHGKR
jgi:hypothetical protein